MKRLRRKSCWNPGQRSWRSRQRESSPGSWDRHVGRVSHRCSRSAQRRTPHGCRQQSGLGKKRMISINWLELLVGNLIVLASLRLFARPVPYGATPLCMKLSQPRITKICFSFKLTTIVAMADQIQPSYRNEIWSPDRPPDLRVCKLTFRCMSWKQKCWQRYSCYWIVHGHGIKSYMLVVYKLIWSGITRSKEMNKKNQTYIPLLLAGEFHLSGGGCCLKTLTRRCLCVGGCLIPPEAAAMWGRWGGGVLPHCGSVWNGSGACGCYAVPPSYGDAWWQRAVASGGLRERRSRSPVSRGGAMVVAGVARLLLLGDCAGKGCHSSGPLCWDGKMSFWKCFEVKKYTMHSINPLTLEL